MTRTNISIVLIAAVAGAVAGTLTTTFITPAPFTPTVAASANDARLAEVVEAQAKLQRALEELRTSQAMLAERSARTPLGAEPAPTKPASADAAATVAAGQGGAVADAPLTVDSALAQLLNPDVTYAERTALWDKINKAGLLHEVVKSMEERAAREPNNPDLRVDLGNAYLQEVFAASAMGKGTWANKANAAFDAALELNPEHWEARFTKAVALSNWPAFMGKQGQAISEFETLVKQQNAGPKKNEHAQTYLFLGNMYQGTGSVAKAIDTWQKGLDLFPDNEDLKQRIADAKKL